MQAKALTTKEEVDELALKMNTTSRDLGIVHHNIRKYQEDADTLHLSLRNLAIDHGKLHEKLQKEQAQAVVKAQVEPEVAPEGAVNA